MSETELETTISGTGTSGVHIKRQTGNPITVAPFDGDEQLDEYVARLQLAAVKEFSQGYYAGKEKYGPPESGRRPTTSKHPVWFAEGFALAKETYANE